MGGAAASHWHGSSNDRLLCRWLSRQRQTVVQMAARDSDERSCTACARQQQKVALMQRETVVASC
jgi:hypothetical protein